MLHGDESLDSALCRLSGARPPTPSVCSRSGRFGCCVSTPNALRATRKQFRLGRNSRSGSGVLAEFRRSDDVATALLEP